MPRPYLVLPVWHSVARYKSNLHDRGVGPLVKGVSDRVGLYLGRTMHLHDCYGATLLELSPNGPDIHCVFVLEQLTQTSFHLPSQLAAMKRVLEKADEQIALFSAKYTNPNLQPVAQGRVRKPSTRIPAETILLNAAKTTEDSARTGAETGQAGPVVEDEADEAALRKNMESARSQMAAVVAVNTMEPDQVEGPLDDDGLPMPESTPHTDENNNESTAAAPAQTSASGTSTSVGSFPPFDESAGTFEAPIYKVPEDQAWGIKFVFLADQTPVIGGAVEDTPASRSIQLKRGMKVVSVNNVSTVGCGSAGLAKIMKKEGLVAKSKKHITMTLECTNSLVPEIAGSQPEDDVVEPPKKSIWSRKPTVKKTPAPPPPKEEDPPPKPAVPSSPPRSESDAEEPNEEGEDTFDDDADTDRRGSQFALKRKLRPLSVKVTSPEEKASIPAISSEEPKAKVSEDGRRLRHRVSLAFGADKGGKAAYLGRESSTRNPLFREEEEDEAVKSDDDREDVDAVLKTSGVAVSQPTQIEYLEDGDYFMRLISNGVSEGDEEKDENGHRYHMQSDGTKVYRASDCPPPPEPSTPTGVRKKFGSLERRASTNERHMKLEGDEDTKFGFDNDDDTDFEDD